MSYSDSYDYDSDDYDYDSDDYHHEHERDYDADPGSVKAWSSAFAHLLDQPPSKAISSEAPNQDRSSPSTALQHHNPNADDGNLTVAFVKQRKEESESKTDLGKISVTIKNPHPPKPT